jgi:nickel/cobalt exporter
VAETLVLLVSSFWLGAVHAATPGHGKTIAAAYIVGARGRPVDALVLGIFVTLSHTSGIVLVAVLASLGSAWLIPHRVEAYLALLTGLLVVAIGVWMLISQRVFLAAARDLEPDHVHAHDHGEHAHDHEHPHDHHHDHGDGEAVYHSHGWGRYHTHRLDLVAGSRPSLPVLLGLGVAGGLLPDPGALAILLAAIASGRVILGLFTVVVFSIGFAAVLVVVGVVAARVGQVVLSWLESRWIARVQAAAALVIVVVGLALTAVAWRGIAQLP